MTARSIGLGSVIGLIAAGLFANFGFERLLGRCFFEQGCGANEDLTILGIVLAAGLTGLCTGWLSARLIDRTVGRPRP